MKRKNYTTFAAIHLGSEMLSMQITEYHNTERYKVIECCNRRIRLGEATFKNKIILPYGGHTGILWHKEVSKLMVDKLEEGGTK